VYWFDESSVNCGMTRLYGRAFSHERVVDYVPDVRFERVSVMGALGVEGFVAPLSFKGTLNGELFGFYVEQVLAPVMKAGDVLVLDNLSSHKVKGVLDPLYKKGVFVVFLPVYSPDFNPVELVWSKIKAYLRKVKARTLEILYSAISEALATITPVDIEGWIKHCGYGL
jgi:transposase